MSARPEAEPDKETHRLRAAYSKAKEDTAEGPRGTARRSEDDEKLKAAEKSCREGRRRRRESAERS